MLYLARNRFCLFALSYSCLETATHFLSGACCAFTGEKESVISINPHMKAHAKSQAVAAPWRGVMNSRHFIFAHLIRASSLALKRHKCTHPTLALYHLLGNMSTSGLVHDEKTLARLGGLLCGSFLNPQPQLKSTKYTPSICVSSGAVY